MIKSAIDVEFEEHVKAQANYADMVKEAFEHQEEEMRTMSHRGKANFMIKKAHSEDQANLALAYAAEAQVYATLALADAIKESSHRR